MDIRPCASRRRGALQGNARRALLVCRKGYDAAVLRHNTQKYISNLTTVAASPMPDQRSLDYQTAFHLAPIGLVLARDRIIEDCNDELAAIFRCRRESLIGQSFQVLYPSADEFERIGARIPPIMTAQGSYADDRIMKRADGELFWCHVTGRSLDRAEPHAAGVWTFEDLSATRRVAVELTPREREIAAQLVTGKTSKQIGRILDISSRTVDVYRARLMRKYGTGNATELLQRLLGQ
ncbi:Transcriptional regulator, LuxR family [Paraburkholderia kururiensis]